MEKRRLIKINEVLELQKNCDFAVFKYLESDLSILEKDVRMNIENNNGHLMYRILLHASIDIKKHFSNTILKSAILGSENIIGSAKEILLSLGHHCWFKESILQKIDFIFQDNKIEKDYCYYYYRNGAQLLYELRFSSELQSFLDNYCKESTDIDVQEVYEDYKE